MHATCMMLGVATIILLASVPCTALNNGLGLKPAMGFNTWNAYATLINETTMKDMVDLMVSDGFVNAGYTYLNLDDGWAANQRGLDGRLEANPRRFPSGVRGLADYVHSKGMKLGIYGDAGYLTCAGFPGSRGFESLDAASYATWGVDYLKYDNCWADKQDWVVDRYTAMRDALNATGRPILFSLCEWGVADPWLWAPKVGNSWRTTTDIQPMWDSMLRCLDNTVGLASFAGPGAWNDPDMLEVGNGQLTLPEQRAHFALWALLKVPLLIGTDLRTASADVKGILLAKEVIAVNQDSLGVAGDLVWKQGPNEVYAAPLAGGGRAVALFNRHNTEYRFNNMTVSWGMLGYDDGEKAAVRDLFMRSDLGTHSGAFTAAVEAHNVLMLRITPLKPDANHEQWRPWHGSSATASSLLLKQGQLSRQGPKKSQQQQKPKQQDGNEAVQLSRLRGAGGNAGSQQ